MLTVIYVYEPATLTIEVEDERDERAMIRRYDKEQPLLKVRELATRPLEPGVYAILSKGALRVHSSSGRIEILPTTPSLAGKDDWPEAPAYAREASPEDLRRFFAKGGDVGE
jgi:hypothetical protein